MKLDDVISTSLGKRVRFRTPRLGIELEFEGFDDMYPELGYWDCEGDPSLRNGGVEFISHPLSSKDLVPALDEVQTTIEDFGVMATDRCGLHVHMNVQYWTWSKLLRYLTLYALMEPTIFHEFADGRQDNHFCVPLTLDNDLIDKIAADAVNLRNGKRHVDIHLTHGAKYSALNLRPIDGQGTMEFRHVRGTTDMIEVQRWCNFLTLCETKAEAFTDSVSIVQYYEDNGLQDMQRQLGLRVVEIDKYWQEEAYIAANLMCGYDEPKWQDMNWEFAQPEAAENVRAYFDREFAIDELLEMDE